jgi:hypothetical protein
LARHQSHRRLRDPRGWGARARRRAFQIYSPHPSEARVFVWHYKGSADLHDLAQWLIVNGPIGGYGGDGQVTRTLYPKQSWHFVIYELQGQTYGGERTTGIQASMTSTVTLALRWQRPVLRWTSTSWRVVLWTPEERAAGRPPKLLQGRPAAAALRAAEEESYRYPGGSPAL